MESDGYRARVAIWVALSVLALAPIFLVRIPPWYDYHNWVFQGRVVADLLGHGPDGANSVRNSYTLSWWPVPNLATPLGIAVLATVVSPDLAGRIFLAITVLSFAFAYAYLVRSLQRRATALEFLGFPFAFGYFFYKGYASYLVSLPIAFLAIAILHRISTRTHPHPTRREVATLAVLGAGLYLSHLIGWSVFMLALAVYGAELAGRGQGRSAIRLWCSSVPALVMLAIYTAMRQHEHNTVTVYYAHLGLSSDKLISLAEPLMLFLRADPFPALVPTFWANLVFMLVLAAIVVVNIDRRGPWSRPLLATGIGLACAALVLPFAGFGDLVRPDERFVLPAVLVLVAALRLKAFTMLRGASIACAIAAIVTLHVVEDRRVSDAAALIERATAVEIPTGARVLSLTIHEGPVQGACSTSGYNPSIGAASLKWLDLHWLVGSSTLNTTLLETSLLRQRSSAFNAPGLTVDVVTLSHAGSQPALSDEYARSYDYVEVFGCADALSEVKNAFAGKYDVVTAGRYFEILTSRANSRDGHLRS